MGQVPAWFERRFEFSFSVEVWPNLCARLRGAPARLEEVARGRERFEVARDFENSGGASAVVECAGTGGDGIVVRG